MKFLTLIIIILLFSGPAPRLVTPLNFYGCLDGEGLSSVEYQIRSDSTIVYRTHHEQFKGDLRLGGWWKYSLSTLEWRKTDQTMSTYAVDTIGSLVYLIPNSTHDEYVRLKEQITICLKEGPTMKEMLSWPIKGNTPAETRMMMQRFEYSDASHCVCETNVLVEKPVSLQNKSDFDSRTKVKK